MDAPKVVALTFDDFRAANVARCLKWHPEGIGSWSASDWLVAVTGELGELASLLKMRNRERDGLPGNKFSPTDKMVADELADVQTYLDLLAASLGVDLGAATVSKFNEVSERVGFPDRITLASHEAVAAEKDSLITRWGKAATDAKAVLVEQGEVLAAQNAKIAALHAELARLREGVEAVAWACQDHHGIQFTSPDRNECVQESHADGSRVIPLFAHPAPAVKVPEMATNDYDAMSYVRGKREGRNACIRELYELNPMLAAAPKPEEG